MMIETNTKRSVRMGLARVLVLCLFVALSLSACGRKSDPSHPDGATYPDEYPTE